MNADVAELADATDLGSVTLRGVEVQILSSALVRFSRARGLAGRRLLCTQEIAGSNPAGSIGRTFLVRKGQRWAIAALSPTQWITTSLYLCQPLRSC